jgi:hypothetical protein
MNSRLLAILAYVKIRFNRQLGEMMKSGTDTNRREFLGRMSQVSAGLLLGVSGQPVKGLSLRMTETRKGMLDMNFTL